MASIFVNDADAAKVPTLSDALKRDLGGVGATMMGLACPDAARAPALGRAVAIDVSHHGDREASTC
jgi:hypothetical protein